MGGAEIAQLLRECRFRYASEEQLQTGIGEVLTEVGIEFDREARLDRESRIDFLIGGVGVEVKIKGSGPLVNRQLRRYARFEAIEELVLVTSRTKHLHVPEEMNGKRLHTVWLSLRGL